MSDDAIRRPWESGVHGNPAAGCMAQHGNLESFEWFNLTLLVELHLGHTKMGSQALEVSWHLPEEGKWGKTFYEETFQKNSLERHRIARGWFAMVAQVRNDNRPPIKTILVCMKSARITLIYFVSVKWWICFPREVKFSFLPNRPCWKGEFWICT